MMRPPIRTLLVLLPTAAVLAACAVSAPPPPAASLPAPRPVVAGAFVAPEPAPMLTYSGSSMPVTAPVLAPGSAVRLSANDALALLSNNTAVGLTNSGVPYEVYFAGDGAARFREATMADAGTWHVLPDGQVCSRLATVSSGSENCYILSRYGDVIMYQSPDGLALGSLRVVSGNPQGI